MRLGSLLNTRSILSCFPIVGGALFGSSCISQSPYDRSTETRPRCMGLCGDAAFAARYPRAGGDTVDPSHTQVSC
jgi:hypothetical protein